MEIYRGDIFYVAKGKYQSSEQGGERPAVVVSNNSCNHFSDCVEIVYLTSQTKKPLPTHVEVVCRCLSTALCEQIYTVHKDRLTDYVRSCTADEMRRIDNALKISLGLGKETPPEDESATESHYMTGGNVAELKARVECLTKNLDELEKHRLEQKNTIESMTNTGMKLMTERDIYKKLYEELLERVTSA